MIDCELEDGEEWFDTMQDLPDLEPDLFFNAMAKLDATAKPIKLVSFAITLLRPVYYFVGFLKNCTTL